MARILIVGGGCRGRQLASRLVAEGYSVRITTRTEVNREAIEASGAECWIGTPDRLATLRGALENVGLVCWLLASVTDSDARVWALHESRLRFFLGQVIDTSVRGFIYEASGTSVPSQVLAAGEQIVLTLAELNAIPTAVLRADPGDVDAWLNDAHASVQLLLSG